MKKSLWIQGNRYPMFEAGDTGYISMPLGNAYPKKYHDELVTEVKIIEVDESQSHNMQSFELETLDGYGMNSFSNREDHTPVYDNWRDAAHAGRKAIAKHVGGMELTKFKLLAIANTVEPEA